VTRALLAALVLLAGCEPGTVGLIGTAARKSKSPLDVPYIVGDPVPNPPVRAAFARAPWLAISTSPLSVTGHFVDAAQNNVIHDVIRREVWGLKRPKLAFEPIDPAELEALQLMPPATHVWLFGSEGPCKATVGAPSVAGHPTVSTVIVVQYALEGCPEAAWAPVGSLADSLPPDVRWVAAEQVAEDRLVADSEWDHPFAPATTWPAAPERVADETLVVARAVRGLDPLPGQTIATSIWRNAGDECLDQESTAVGHLLLRTSGAEAQTPLPEVETVVELLGAVAQGESAEAIVFGDRIDLFVAVPPASPEDRPDLPPEVDRGPATWTASTIESGPRTEVELADAEYRVTPRCEP
jgi:hypothetical protein